MSQPKMDSLLTPAADWRWRFSVTGLLAYLLDTGIAHQTPGNEGIMARILDAVEQVGSAILMEGDTRVWRASMM